jgi:MerR family transcriptional regulator, light-induced transcriptional regulator
METPALRIGAVARRTGVAVATLRAWESRYGVLQPTRTEGGHRLYSEEDVDRVLAVLRLTAQGWSVSAAARSVTAERSPPARTRPDPTRGSGPAGRERDDRVRDDADRGRLRDDLARAIRTFDASAAEEVLDTGLARTRGRVHARGRRHAGAPGPRRRLGGRPVADRFRALRDQHAATATAPSAHRRASASAPTCIAAAPEPEDHELGVLAAAAIAADLGFRVTYLGSRTPTVALERSIATLRPDVVLIGAMTARRAGTSARHPPRLGDARLVVGGAGLRRRRGRTPGRHDAGGRTHRPAAHPAAGARAWWRDRLTVCAVTSARSAQCRQRR